MIMEENELVLLSFCELLQSEEKETYVKPFLDCEFEEDTKGIVLVRTNVSLLQSALVEIKVNEEIIWTSRIRKTSIDINYISEDNNLDLYISETAFLSRNVVDGINMYSIELKNDGIIIGQASFQASIKSTDDCPSNINCDNLISDESKEDIKTHNEEQIFSAPQNLTLDQLVEYKEIIKYGLDDLIDKTKTICDRNYFKVIATPALMDIVKEIDKLRQEIGDKVGTVLSFYSKSYDYIQDSIESEKINIAKKLLDNGLEQKTISNIVNLSINKFV